MGLFDGVLGGILGAGALTVVTKYVNDHGGLQGVVDQFSKQGLGGTINSWIGMGDNEPVTADQITQAVGSDKLHEMAKEAGVEPAVLAGQLAEHLPTAIDKLTPTGKLPDAAAVTSAIPQAPKL